MTNITQSGFQYNAATGMPTVAEVDAAIKEAGTSPATSDWLRSALMSSTRRDPLDALVDARALAFWLNERHEAVMYAAYKALYESSL